MIPQERKTRKRRRSREAAQVIPRHPIARPAGRSEAVRHLLCMCALAAVVAMFYSNSFRAPFLMDNESQILDDARVHEATSANVRSIVTRQYSPKVVTELYRPLTTLSYMFNYAVLENQTRPAGYHWFNLLLHVANTCLVYLIGWIVFGSFAPALLMGGLWALHPVQTESVTNIVGRADMLAALGVLSAVLCHRRAAQTSGAAKAAWLAATAMSAAIGIFSKESGIVVLAVIPLCDLAFARKGPWRARVPGYIAAVLPCALFLYFRSRALAAAPWAPFPFPDNPLTGADFWAARITAMKVIGRYFGLFLWPARLSCNYSYNEVPLFAWGALGWEDAKAVLATLCCMALAVAAVLSYRRRKPVFFFIAFFFVTLAPVSNVVLLIGSIMAERFLYLPSIGFAGLAVWGVYALSRRFAPQTGRWREAAAPVVLMLAALAFGIRAYARNLDWLDNQHLWGSAVEAAPGSYYTHNALASTVTILQQRDADRSIDEIGRALAILDPLPDARNSGTAYLDAGVIYRMAGDRAAAAKTQGRTDSQNAAYWYTKSLNALLRQERIERAQDEINRRENLRRGKPALTSMPERMYLEMGRTYIRLSDPRNAAAAFERGRTVEPDPDLLEELSSVYGTLGDPRRAAAALVEALAIDDSRVNLQSKLVELYGQIDPGGCAVTLLQGGQRALNPDCPLVHTDVCAASRNVAGIYLRRGQPADAEKIKRIAVSDLGCKAELLQ